MNAHPLDPDLCKAISRAEAAEARGIRHSPTGQDMNNPIKPVEFESDYDAGFRNGKFEGAEQMRERAAKLAQDHAEFCMNEAHKGGDWKYLKDRADCAAFIAEKIRALPLEPESHD